MFLNLVLDVWNNIVNFLLEHLRTPKVDFYKIRFPSYIKYLNNIK